MKFPFRLFCPMHVARLGSKRQHGEDFLHDRPYGGQRPRGGTSAHAFVFDVGIMVLAAGLPSALEMVEAQFAVEFLVLFDRPSLVRQGDQRAATTWRADGRSNTSRGVSSQLPVRNDDPGNLKREKAFSVALKKCQTRTLTELKKAFGIEPLVIRAE